MKDSIQIIQDSIQNHNQKELLDISQQNTGFFNFWLVIAIIEFFLIIILIIKIKKVQTESLLHNDRFNELRKVKSQNIDMENLMNSINLSKDLYKELSRKCHPDKFQERTIKTKANKIFQEVTKNKRNFAKLTELKEIAKQELNIKF